jgi:hypothetical protein
MSFCKVLPSDGQSLLFVLRFIFKLQQLERNSNMASINTTKKVAKKKSVNGKSKTREPKDFAKYALVAENYPIEPDPLTMDGTSHTEISIMANAKYSHEIVGEGHKIFNLKKLEMLKGDKPDKYLEEGKRQIIGLWQCIESINTHTALFNVAFLIAIGKILNDIEDTFKKKSDYMAWLRDNFGHHHLRYFQHAKQLERMGDFARAYASLGKNRLLEFDRLKRSPMQSYEDVLKMYPFEDTAADHDGVLFKEHVDGIITFCRLKEAGIEELEFDQAVLIAAHSGEAITVKNAKSISSWLKEIEDQKQALDDLILNKLASPYGDGQIGRRPVSLTKHIADLIKYSESTDIENDAWIANQRDQVSEVDIVKVHLFIVKLAEKLEIELNNNQNTPETATGERSKS